MGNIGATNLEVACQLFGIGGSLSLVDLLPDNSTVGIWLATIPLQGVVTYSGTGSLQLQCFGAPNVSGNLFAYYPRLTAIPATNLNLQ